jgi:tRNA threonylcarbamoyladenosine biosynthesis protein TsaB
VSGGAVLGIDTATAYAAVAVTAPGEVLCETEGDPAADGRPRHSQVLLVAVEDCVESAGGWERIGRLAVGVGPGSYTGLRIGIATARALSQARGLPIAAVSTLAALGRGIGERPAAAAAVALPVIDARRGEVFAGAYGPGGEQLRAPFVRDPARLGATIAELGPAVVAAGDGSVRFRAELEAAGATVLPVGDPAHRVAGRHVCSIGAGESPTVPGRIEPTYLRAPDADRWLRRDGKTIGG